MKSRSKENGDFDLVKGSCCIFCFFPCTSVSICWLRSHKDDRSAGTNPGAESVFGCKDLSSRESVFASSASIGTPLFELVMVECRMLF